MTTPRLPLTQDFHDFIVNLEFTVNYDLIEKNEQGAAAWRTQQRLVIVFLIAVVTVFVLVMVQNPAKTTLQS
jgi:hypothetical protein